ncbi:MAG: glycosyltransferase 87 family protein [Patescibacteria group bacterium]
MKRVKWLTVAYLVAAVFLLLYSYTQVDLNLTLSRVSIWQTIQKSFQYIGFFRRPLSTWLYLAILALFFGLYAWSLNLVSRGKLTEVVLWRLIGLISLILLFSYPAFSHDMFNYMFTAKTVLIYHKNPYLVIPQQFAGVEPWVNFMRWVHLPSAYTPFWILLTLPSYLLGFGFFLTIMWSIKLLVAFFHLATIWGIGRVLEKVEPKQKILGMAIFALNPLIIIENLVSSHNDVVMMALVVWAWLLFLERKKVASWFVLSLSVAAKLMTIFLIPVFVFGWRRAWALAAMLLGLVLVVLQREILPWYWVWIMPFVALLPSASVITILSTGVSLGLLLRYAPYLYLGHWDPPVPTIKAWVTSLPILVAILVVLFLRVRKRHDPQDPH